MLVIKGLGVADDIVFRVEDISAYEALDNICF